MEIDGHGEIDFLDYKGGTYAQTLIWWIILVPGNMQVLHSIHSIEALQELRCTFAPAYYRKGAVAWSNKRGLRIGDSPLCSLHVAGRNSAATRVGMPIISLRRQPGTCDASNTLQPAL